MYFVEAFRESGVFAKLSLFLGFGPLAVAIVYAYRPSDRPLALLRPLSLASIFGAIAGLTAGLTTVLMGLAATPPGNISRAVYAGLSEALVPALVNFGLLAVSWVLVTLGMLRRPTSHLP